MTALAGITLAMVRTFFDAFVLWCLWGWFAVPAGMHPVGYWTAFGLDMIVGYVALCTVKPTNDEPASVEKVLAGVFGKGIGFALLLAGGWGAHVMMGGA